MLPTSIELSCITVATRVVTITPLRNTLSYSDDVTTRLSPDIDAVAGTFGRPSRLIVQVEPSADPTSVLGTGFATPSSVAVVDHVPAKLAGVFAAGTAAGAGATAVVSVFAPSFGAQAVSKEAMISS